MLLKKVFRYIILFSKENYCSPSPCYYGRCTVNTTIPTGYLCQCDKGWGGNHCDKCTEVNCDKSILVLFNYLLFNKYCFTFLYYSVYGAVS